MNRCPYCAVVCATSTAPLSGKSTIGSKAVAAIGIASVTHQIAIHAVDAKTARPAGSSPSGRKKTRINAKASGSGEAGYRFFRQAHGGPGLSV